jgi:hypothetical protein
MARLVVSGFLVRFPIGGYAWQAAHYLLGFRALGHDVWFYEDTGLYAHAYNPATNAYGPNYAYGVDATGRFLERLGLGDRWAFLDLEGGRRYGPAASGIDTLLRDADLVVNVAGVNRVPADQRGRRPQIYVDIDPAFTQIKATQDSSLLLRAMLDEQHTLFTYGENIGTPRSGAPDAGYRWHPTRCPVVLSLWEGTAPTSTAYTTVGRWNDTQRDLEWAGETFQWRKRTEWLRCLDLPARTGADFELAMDVENVPGDVPMLRAHGWHIADPRDVSADPWRYRDYIRGSRGEFTVAKELNVRLRSGWFSDRAACYLAAGRPVVEQDTGFGDVLPLGPGVHAFRTVAEAAAAIDAIERDWPAASTHALAVAREWFAAERVLGDILRVIGM